MTDREGFVLTATGEQAKLGLKDGRVVPIGCEPLVGGGAIVERWLTAAASTVLAARRERAQRGRAVLSPSEQKGALPTSLEGLLAYIGFEA